MTLQERKNNTYYDQTGTQILEGDLLKVFHFRRGKRKWYMYQVAVIDSTGAFPVMGGRAYISTIKKPHYYFHQVVNADRVYLDAKIINKYNFTQTRLRLPKQEINKKSNPLEK